MKKISIVLTICLVALFSTEQVHAQLSKKEKKEWKTKAKQYKKNPQALKQLDDDRSNLDTEVSNLKSQIQSLQSKLSDKDATIASLQSDIQKSRADLMAARKQVSELQAAKTPAVSSGGKMVDGVVFKVQIGAFRNKDLSKYFENHENFSGEVDED
ncbi:MAG: Ezrin/radixin/moesin family protein, partial [Cyclobacteriaceae bacterium]|nr:Ezrin/radixin/moesin family protein [Cyclobacteriaceae bacterium]